ncbi:Crp/Fnr family transcriptional regulator [Elizabethkingia meningoseptica]|uniref:Crp/Fnr family transcriptional regulator n=1 Tax=Elizabethkingia meningoseptica TaxID=238 RepID=UPI000936E2B4|nr:Crp/Fnr family transcriptional regulator [Elizabethkingia meningoseptica]EJK5327365.1 Crp/Fnr family transcriptional regulator [Elizabethkingia meningoseptica]MDE5467000.1 Crp/Fnr family transcriptional regulator [Elizabethkingia meningoseptica]MDE5473770.1 Crp/Fnr family transcriptional regulator [Elizabethkingia meningoseptica]MDE5477203.1 Crp/Fnr family transcriptional regulator [Elizabethkingia meningoseptica]MDE5484319.1 Crp/Fnr family transcriptional regulator [Elizabethkingia meningo
MITEFFKQFGIFTTEEITELVPLFKARNLNKGDFFVREHEKHSEVAFVQSGIFRSFYTTAAGNDMTYCFRFPNEFVAAYSSFITGDKSTESIQAISPAAILVIEKSTINRLELENPKWSVFLKIMAEQQFLELEKRVFQLQRETSSQRYSNLLNNQPELVREIPLQYLASYLGITQRHLSRIRQQISF